MAPIVGSCLRGIGALEASVSCVGTLSVFLRFPDLYEGLKFVIQRYDASMHPLDSTSLRRLLKSSTPSSSSTT